MIFVREITVTYVNMRYRRNSLEVIGKLGKQFVAKGISVRSSIKIYIIDNQIVQVIPIFLKILYIYLVYVFYLVGSLNS